MRNLGGSKEPLGVAPKVLPTGPRALRMVTSMANASKRKGDVAERQAVRMLCELAPDLIRHDADRMWGAGRKNDHGDLDVFDDVAIQVRNYQLQTIGAAIRSSAVDSVTQAAHRRVRLGVGLVPYPGARQGTVRWLACARDWPYDLEAPGEHCEGPVEFAMVSKALAWVRDDQGPYGYRARPRETRVVRLTGPGAAVLVAPVEAWLAAYRAHRIAEAGLGSLLTTPLEVAAN